MDNPLISVFTLTCNRPELLGRVIKCFERQTYQNKFMLILDDLGQYENQKGEQWELISLPRRISSLAEKNNVAISLLSKETKFIGKMDDDDWFAPHHLESLVESLHRGEFVQPRLVCDFWEGSWKQVETFNKKHPNHYCYHSSWGYTRKLFEKVGGYKPGLQAGDDGEFQKRVLKLGVRSVDTLSKYEPSYWYNRPLLNRISEKERESPNAYWKFGENISYVGKVPKWEDDSDWLRPIPTERINRPW